MCHKQCHNIRAVIVIPQKNLALWYSVDREHFYMRLDFMEGRWGQRTYEEKGESKMEKGRQLAAKP